MFPFDLPGFQIQPLNYSSAHLTIFADSLARQAACPNCQSVSSSILSYYLRKAKDLPLALHSVQLNLRLPRFRCLNPLCPKLTFVLPLPELLPRHAQRTIHFNTALKELGLELSAQVAA